jgi:hypothetical protein
MAGPKELATSWQATKAEAGNETGSQSRKDSIRKALAEQAGNGGDFCLPSPMRWRESRESTTPQRPPPDAHPPWRAEPRFGTRGLSSPPQARGRATCDAAPLSWTSHPNQERGSRTKKARPPQGYQGNRARVVQARRSADPLARLKVIRSSEFLHELHFDADPFRNTRP